MNLYILNGRNVYVAEKHHHVLAAWAAHRRTVAGPPHLITLDDHTDLQDAFLGACAPPLSSKESAKEAQACRAKKIEKIDFRNQVTVENAIRELRYDEHIDCAQKTQIIDKVFVYLGLRSGGRARARQYVYQRPCLPECKLLEHTSRCVRKHADALLDPKVLDPWILQTQIEIGLLEQAKYILDIDLDYFRTSQGAQPANPSAFHKLVRHAQLITIAREPSCVKDGRLPKEKITSDSLQLAVFKLISDAPVVD